MLFEQALLYFFMQNAIVLHSSVFIIGVIIIISLLYVWKNWGKA